MVTTSNEFREGALISTPVDLGAAAPAHLRSDVSPGPPPSLPRQMPRGIKPQAKAAPGFQQRGARTTPAPDQEALMALQATQHAKQAMSLAAQYPLLGDQLHPRQRKNVDPDLHQHSVYELKADIVTIWDGLVLKRGMRNRRPSFDGLYRLEMKMHEERRHEQWTAWYRELLAEATSEFGGFYPIVRADPAMPSGRRVYRVHLLAILAAHDFIDSALPDGIVLWRYDGETLDEARDRVFPLPEDQDFMAETARILRDRQSAQARWTPAVNRTETTEAESFEPVDPVARAREAYEVLVAYAMQEQPILPLFNAEVFNNDMRGAALRWCEADGNLDSLGEQDYEQIRRLFLAYGYPVWGYPVPPEREPPLFDPLSLLMPAAAAAAAEVAEIAEESIPSTLEQFPEILPFDDDEE